MRLRLRSWRTGRLSARPAASRWPERLGRAHDHLISHLRTDPKNAANPLRFRVRPRHAIHRDRHAPRSRLVCSRRDTRLISAILRSGIRGADGAENECYGARAFRLPGRGSGLHPAPASTSMPPLNCENQASRGSRRLRCSRPAAGLYWPAGNAGRRRGPAVGVYWACTDRRGTGSRPPTSAIRRDRWSRADGVVNERLAGIGEVGQASDRRRLGWISQT